ncbi:copper chaperone PCu(A)C [Xanthomonas sp. 60]
MITKPFVGVLSVVLALAAAPAAWAAGPVLSCVKVTGGWVRVLPAPSPMRMTAGYGHIHNGCARAVTIVAASSPAFGHVTLHETVVEDGVSKMRPLPELRLAAGATATLQPTGMHLMLMGAATLKDGQQVPVVFELDGGSEVRGVLQARTTAP